jgi:hypothetical protein
VQVLHGRQNLSPNATAFILAQFSLFQNMAVQLAVLIVWKNNIHGLGSVNNLEQIADIWMLHVGQNQDFAGKAHGHIVPLFKNILINAFDGNQRLD